MLTVWSGPSSTRARARGGPAVASVLGMDVRTDLELRLAVLAASVLRDLDVAPDHAGVGLPGAPPLHLSWAECRAALGSADPRAPAGRDRLARHLLARRWAADLPAVELGDLLRPVGLPVGHALHPGPRWVRERVLGGVLELGFGAAGLDPAAPAAVVLLPPAVLAEHLPVASGPAGSVSAGSGPAGSGPAGSGLDADQLWREARTYLEDMGSLAARLGARGARGQLRPVGDCDVATLLGARSLRRWLAADTGTGAAGMGAAVVPMRTRGWTRLAGVDPAFGPAAAAATDPSERGFERPVLITVDEVTLVPAGGR